MQFELGETRPCPPGRAHKDQADQARHARVRGANTLRRPRPGDGQPVRAVIFCSVTAPASAVIIRVTCIVAPESRAEETVRAR